MGKITGAPIVLWKILESETELLISDAKGLLEDLSPGATNVQPVVEEGGIGGFRRVFDGSIPTGVEVVDTPGDLDLRRSVTFQCIATLDLAAQDAAGVPGTIVSYGFRDSSGEDLQFLVELDVVNLATRLVRVKARWEDTGGALESGNTGATVVWPTEPPGVDAELVLTIVREWRGPTDVIVRYYGNEVLLGEDNSTDGDIGGAAGATVLLGVRGDGAGAYENYFEGKLGASAIFDFPMTAEEIRQRARAITVHPGEQYELLKSLLPESVWSNDPSSIFQRELFVEAQMFADVVRKLAELREDFLPDRAWSELDSWETLLALPPAPGDTLAERRNRLLTALRATRGLSKPAITAALTAVFGLTSAQIQILEFDHLLTDDFATALADFWQQIDTTAGTTTIVSGAARIESPSGTDHRWSANEAPHIKCVIDRDERDTDPSLDAEINVQIDAEVFTVDGETIIGCAFMEQATNSLEIFGLARIAGATRLARLSISNGAEGSLVDLGAPPARPFFLNFKYGDFSGPNYEMSTALVADRNVLTIVGQFTGVANPAMVALGSFGLVAGGPTANNSADFDDFRLYTPNGLRVFNWYAYRDPALAGDFDIPGATKIVERIKPAHTHACATARLALLTDDPESLLDCGPLGG